MGDALDDVVAAPTVWGGLYVQCTFGLYLFGPR